MQEVEGWAVEGSTNYFDLRGDTGPLVYPAGFLYIYRFLRWITGGGRGPAAIRLAQWAFVALYVATLAVMVRIYKNAKLGSPWLIGLLCVSKRVHSLFMLRLFNDCWAMLFVYAAVLLCQKHKVRTRSNNIETTGELRRFAQSQIYRLTAALCPFDPCSGCWRR